MLGFFSFGTSLTILDQACKNRIEAQKDETFPRDLEESRGWIRLYKNHNPGFSFGFMKGSKAVELVPLCMNSALAGVWAYLMGTRGKILEKTAITLTLAGGLSNLYDRYARGYVVDYFSIQWKSLKKVVLNIGDICIILGSVLLIAGQAVEMIRELMEPLKNKRGIPD